MLARFFSEICANVGCKTRVQKISKAQNKINTAQLLQQSYSCSFVLSSRYLSFLLYIYFLILHWVEYKVQFIRFGTTFYHRVFDSIFRTINLLIYFFVLVCKKKAFAQNVVWLFVTYACNPRIENLRVFMFIALAGIQWLGIWAVAEQANSLRHIYNETRQVRVVAGFATLRPLASRYRNYKYTVADFTRLISNSFFDLYTIYCELRYSDDDLFLFFLLNDCTCQWLKSIIACSVAKRCCCGRLFRKLSSF